ncbi:hypothetical protein [Kitasatospora herbaricolor]|uniref:hypothetical protein n=1 Tax=Kitasatospora herbaricolor TaxID=68217 RepID=UPI0036DB3D12
MSYDLPTDPPSPPPRDRDRPWLLPTITGVAGFVVGVMLVGGIGLGISASNAAQHAGAVAKADTAKKTAEKKAKAAESAKKYTLLTVLTDCGLGGSTDAELADDGYTLTVNGQGNDDYSGLQIDDEACILDALKAPSAVVSHVDQTTSMDGRQTETWGDVTMAWSYHPDRGLDAVFTVAK